MGSTNDSVMAAVAARDEANRRAGTAYYVLRSYISHVLAKTGSVHQEVPHLYPEAAELLVSAINDVLRADD